MSGEPDGREPSWLAVLNEAQRRAVLHFGPPLLILAGAGSGKTRVITTKIAWLVRNQGIDSRAVLAVTFTNKAAAEMRERVRDLVPEAGEVMVRTFHSFGAWLLRRNAALLGLPSHFSIYDEGDVRTLLKSLLGREAAGERVEELSRWIDRAKERGLTPGDDLESVTVDPTFPELYRIYQEGLTAAGAADFGDLILGCVRLLRGFPEVRARVRQRFRVIMVDEFQDSNSAQLQLLQELYDPENYICVVGDEDQSIYGFRGAELRNILDFPRLFSGTEIIRLEENYRSTQNILRAASGVVAHNVERLGKTLFTRRGAGQPLVLAHLDDQEREAQFCADLLGDGRYGDTAILYRMNFQSRAFETLFTRLGIPYRVVGTLRFYEREEIKDALAWLFLLLNDRDEVAFRRAVGKPRRGIGVKTVDRIVAEARRGGQGLLAAAGRLLGSLPSKTARGLQEFLELLERLGESLEAGGALSSLVHRMVLDSGLYQYYGARDGTEAEPGSNPRVKNLEELVTGTVEYAGGRDGLLQFLEGIELGAMGENPYERADRVTLITVHNTKGLEFNRVIITGLEEGVFPVTSGLNPYGEAEDAEEERRLFYVAVTRARERLVLTTCRQRRIFGRTTERLPSRFLKEIPEDILEIWGRDEAEAEDDPFPLGCGVYHEDYGPGLIVRKWLEDGEPMVVIRFRNGKSGRFILRYTPLERLAAAD